MRALILAEVGQPLRLEEKNDLTANPRGAVVAVHAAALNRRDFWITQGKYPGIKLPAVLGSDGAGIVAAVGSAVDPKWLGKKVIINPSIEWGPRQEAQGRSFQILGMPEPGTFASQVHVAAEQLYEMPGHLDFEHAAAVPLAGLTAYRALFSQGGLQPGENVLVTGAGGGVASLAIQFAHAAGAKVIATSSIEAKRKKACDLGAIAAFNYREPNWANQLRQEVGEVQLVIDGSGGDTFASLLEALQPGGRLVNYGVTGGFPDSLDLFRLFWHQLRIIGSTMGSPRDFADMIAFVSKHRIEPVVDRVFPLAEGNMALAHLAEFGHFGKVVLSTQS